jgi:hypothetical protein
MGSIVPSPLLPHTRTRLYSPTPLLRFLAQGLMAMPGTFATLDTVRKVGIGEKNLIFPNRIFTDAGWHLTYVP